RKQTDLRNVASPLSNGLYVQLDPVSVEFELMHPVAAIRGRSSFFAALRRNEPRKLFLRSGSQLSLQRCMLFCGSSSSSSFQARIAALRLEQTLFRTPNMVAALGYLLHRSQRECAIRSQVCDRRRILRLDVLVVLFDQQPVRFVRSIAIGILPHAN